MAGEDPPRDVRYRRARSVPSLCEEARTFFRLSPDRPYFAVRRGDVQKRLDYHYHRPEFVLKVRALERCQYGVAPLSQLIGPEGEIQNFGAYSLCNFIRFVDEGIPFVKVENYTEEGIRWNECRRITADVHDLLWKSKLQRGDVLLSMAGSIGISTVVRDEREANSNQAIAKIRVRTPRVSIDFLSCFFNSDVGRKQSLRVSNGGVQLNINLGEIGTLLIPTPPDDVQTRVVAALDAARAARRRKLEEADSLLGGLDAFVLGALGLTLPPRDARTVYAVRLRDVERGRFDPHFFRPEYRELARRIAKTTHRPLGKLVRLSREMWSPGESDAPMFRYIEISGVNTTTGEATAVETPVAEAPSRARMQVRRGDVIVSLTRPHYGAIAAIDDSLDGCIASTGFAILRESLVDKLDRSYLWTILRCQISLMQMQQRSSGGNYPAITEDELQRVMVPVPADATQKKIAAEVSRRRDSARRLRDEAGRLWDDAKRRFEEALLGPAK